MKQAFLIFGIHRALLAFFWGGAGGGLWRSEGKNSSREAG